VDAGELVVHMHWSKEGRLQDRIAKVLRPKSERHGENWVKSEEDPERKSAETKDRENQRDLN